MNKFIWANFLTVELDLHPWNLLLRYYIDEYEWYFMFFFSFSLNKYLNRGNKFLELDKIEVR